LDFLQLALMGGAIGCIYGLVALGFLMIYLAVRALNFAQGELVMIGGYLAIWGYQVTGSLLGAAVVSGAAMMAWGAVFQRLAYYPLRHKSIVTVIISTIAMSIVLRNVALNAWGPAPLRLPSFFEREMLSLGGINLPTQLLAIIAITALVLSAQYVFFRHTRIGKMMQATAQDPEAARLTGIPVERIILYTFMLSAVLAGAAGLMLAPVFFVYPDMGAPILIKGWVGIVVGGFGSIPGAVAGGLLIGLLETFTAAFISSDFKDALTLAVLIVFLVLRPEGLFGERIGEKL
jgi:branched-chain amino acid transport system permease protein